MDDGQQTDDVQRTTKPAYTISSPEAFGSAYRFKDYKEKNLHSDEAAHHLD